MNGGRAAACDCADGCSGGRGARDGDTEADNIAEDGGNSGGGKWHEALGEVREVMQAVPGCGDGCVGYGA